MIDSWTDLIWLSIIFTAIVFRDITLFAIYSGVAWAKVLTFFPGVIYNLLKFLKVRIGYLLDSKK